MRLGKTLLVVCVLLLVVLAGCKITKEKSKEVPPEPDTSDLTGPMGQAFSVYGGIPTGYAPPWDTLESNNLILDTFMVEKNIINVRARIEVSHPGGFIYKRGYIIKLDDSGVPYWKAFEFPQDRYTGTEGGSPTNWITDAASIDITLDLEDYEDGSFNDGQIHALAYSCKLYDGYWKCSCVGDLNACRDIGGWRIQYFEFSENTRTPTCTVDDDCISGQKCDSGVCVPTGPNVGSCGDDLCTGDEDCSNCALDCGTCSSGGSTCGDGMINQISEECDDGNINPDDGCSENCKFAGVENCNDDNTIDGTEFCDGTDLAGLDCTDFGFNSGTLACTDCGFDASSCTLTGDLPFCGDGTCNNGENSFTCNRDCPLVQTCTDSDDGIDYNTQGTVSVVYAGGGYTETKTDDCIPVDSTDPNSPDVLREYYCLGDIYLMIPVICGNICADGACLSGASCMDSGDDPFTKGVIEPPISYSSVITISEDSCINFSDPAIVVPSSGILAEVSCDGATSIIKVISCDCVEGICTNTVTCGDGLVEAGEECDDGNMDNDDDCSDHCLLYTNTCTDSDGGLIEDFKGTTQGTFGGQPGKMEDSCSGNDVIETYCEDEFIRTKTITCDGGCTDGACVNPTPFCGDGDVNSVSEECDDGNNIDGDDCDKFCKLEGTTGGTCGDGALDALEVCDGNDLDGNTCQSLGFNSGTLYCALCELDTSSCVTNTGGSFCGDGTCDTADGEDVSTCDADCVAPYCTPATQDVDCDDSDACTTDTCNVDTCVNTVSVTCDSPPNNECYQLTGTCDPADGSCSYVELADGTSCDTSAGTCQGGVCVAIGTCGGDICDSETEFCVDNVCKLIPGQKCITNDECQFDLCKTWLATPVCSDNLGEPTLT